MKSLKGLKFAKGRLSENFEPEPYVEDPDFVATTAGRKVKVSYDGNKDILFIQVEFAPEPIKLHAGNIDQFIRVLQKARGNQ